MSALKIGDRALDFNLPATDGKHYSLESFKDKKSLAVVFSCVHCPYVKAWEDRLIALQKEYADKGVAFVLICANDAVKYPQDSFSSMKKQARDKNYPFPYLHDESQEVAKAYGAQRTPEIFLFGQGRKLAYHGAVDDNYEDPGRVRQAYFRDAVQSVLEGKPAPKPETAPAGCTIKWK
ncbi:MAG TPA: thioredoxin family protein [archaeon]|nr:thioredoxin family protein [archaeon]